MPKLRKMLGGADTPECAALMRRMETQSKHTIAVWAVEYAAQAYLPLCPEDERLTRAVEGCRRLLAGECKLAQVKPLLRDARAAAQQAQAPAAQAAARAVATACAAVQTPTNGLGFVFYGAAAWAYHTAGLERSPEEYDRLAAEEFGRAQAALEARAVPQEPDPARLDWGC